MPKTLFDQYEIKKILKSFDGEKVKEIDIYTLEMIHINFKNPIIEINSDETKFRILKYQNKRNDDYIATFSFNSIKGLEIDELKEIDSVKIYFDKGTSVCIYYEN